MKLDAKSGAIAAAAALLVVSAAAPVTPATAASNYKVKCFGLNACKGKGFVMMSKSTCTAKGGSTTHG